MLTVSVGRGRHAVAVDGGLRAGRPVGRLGGHAEVGHGRGRQTGQGAVHGLTGAFNKDTAYYPIELLHTAEKLLQRSD